MLSNNPHHIIAIGASAGGMEELKTFFDNTPLDGVCYVIVQHLSPDFKKQYGATTCPSQQTSDKRRPKMKCL